MAEAPPPPYTQGSPQPAGANPYHAGYDQPGNGQFKYGPYPQQQQATGPYPPGQNRRFGAYPLTQQPATPTTQVNVTQVSAAPVIMGVSHRDYTCSAIWACLCCFWPAGIVAIYYANKAQDEYGQGDIAAAESSNRTARMFIIISIVIGILIVVGAIIAGIAVGVAAASAAVNDFSKVLNDNSTMDNNYGDFY